MGRHININRAFEIVVELARQNIHEDSPEQTLACDVVEECANIMIRTLELERELKCT